MTAAAVIDHLWQSSLVVAAIALLGLAFRHTQARTRYWIWFAASLKFLIPFSALSSLGAGLEWREALPPVPAEWTGAIDAVRGPFSAPPIDLGLRASGESMVDPAAVGSAIWILGTVAILAVWLLRCRRISAAVHAGSPLESGRIRDAVDRLEPASALRVVYSDTSLEPGIFGILRPVLLWPREIDLRLDDAQVHAILAHEVAHVRRRDNLTAAVHMVAEALFWFHPLVWWIGARLVDERERACDEEVVRLGSEPHVYAESILRTCQFCVESPVPCVSGVTGSNLKTRIERIMAHRPARPPSRWITTLLLTAAVMMLAGPVAIGALTAPRPSSALALTPAADRPSFAAATVTPNTTRAMRVMMRMLPGGSYDASNVTLESMIRMAYRLQEYQLAGGPAWIYTDRFDIQARSPAGSTPSEFGRRMQSLLADRFELQLHVETQNLPIFALVPARRDEGLGPGLTAATVDCAALARERAGTNTRGGTRAPAPRQPGERPTCGTITGPGRLTGGGVTMEQLAAALSQYAGRIVVDRTGASGSFDYDLEFAPDSALRGRGPGGGLPGAPLERERPAQSGRVSIFAAVEEQLGLKLEARRATVDVMAIDSVEKPTEN